MQKSFHMLAGEPSGAMTFREFADAMEEIGRRHAPGSASAVTAGFNLMARCLESNGFVAGVAAYRALAPELFANADAFDLATGLLGSDVGAAYADEVSAAAAAVSRSGAGGDDGEG